jgi:hypothetical protein
MRVLLIGVAAAMMLAALGSVGSKAQAAMTQAMGTLPLHTKSHSRIVEIGYYRRHARRAYRRGYRRGYYGYGYPYYGYRPYGYYGYGWRRPGLGIYVGPGWGWGY